MNEWFCYDKEENASLPQLVHSFSTETRQSDKLAIRMVIWQAVLCFRFTLTPLETYWSLVLYPFLILREYAGWKRQQLKENDSQCVKRLLRSGQCGSLNSVALRTVSQSIASQLCRVCTLPLNSCYVLFIRGLLQLILLGSWSGFLGEGITVAYFAGVLIYGHVNLFACACVCF